MRHRGVVGDKTAARLDFAHLMAAAVDPVMDDDFAPNPKTVADVVAQLKVDGVPCGRVVHIHQDGTYDEWVGSGRVTIRHVSPIPPLDPCVRLSSHTAHDRGDFTGNFPFTNSTDFTVVSLRIRWLPLYHFPHPLPQGLCHVRGFPAFRLLCPI